MSDEPRDELTRASISSRARTAASEASLNRTLEQINSSRRAVQRSLELLRQPFAGPLADPDATGGR